MQIVADGLNSLIHIKRKRDKESPTTGKEKINKIDPKIKLLEWCRGSGRTCSFPTPSFMMTKTIEILEVFGN